ncbi:serine/threonine-protein phosphatase 4 regulatory subunit 2 [Nematostella vectensis]|uniref:serine/threonine-protein phosphatase 4 regulatory subunit 2 n=1 Tax=Nematostella vectensis TaxID=45351 RepID=UPI0020772C95|nr:serine/threonine-protein phosphatase 4 regulatory subunit 2 [Nematostella vectensis]
MDLFTFCLVIVASLANILLVSCAANRPQDMSQGIFCECCSATVKELTKKLQKKSSDPWEVKVVEAMEDICNVNNFRAYDYSPPTTIKGCKFIMDKFDEDIESVLIKKDPDPEKTICYEVTKACEGVDRTKKEKEEMDVRINDKKQNIKQQQPDDGIQRMNVDINDPNSASRLAEQIKQQIAEQQAMGGGGGSDDDDEQDDADEQEPEDDGDEGNEKSSKKTQSKDSDRAKTEL